MDEKRRLAPRRPALVTARARQVRGRTRQCSTIFLGIPMAHGQSRGTFHGRRFPPWKADSATDPNAAEPCKLLEKEGWRHPPLTPGRNCFTRSIWESTCLPPKYPLNKNDNNKKTGEKQNDNNNNTSLMVWQGLTEHVGKQKFGIHVPKSGVNFPA